LHVIIVILLVILVAHIVPWFGRLLDLLIWLIFILLLLAIARSHAAPPEGADPNSPLGLWYRSLHVPHSDALCCSISDCRPVEARAQDGHWQIKLGRNWRDVPEDRVLRMDNPDGRPIACVEQFDDAPDAIGPIRCFVPPPET